MSSRDDTWQPRNRLAQLCLVGLMVTLLAVACCGIHVEPGPEMTEYEKLDELGIDKETYRAMSVEQQIEIFVEME